MQPIPAPEINPESFILYEDDEWFSTMQISEQQPPEAAHQDVNDSFDETIEDIANTAVRKCITIFIVVKKINFFF